MQETKTNTVVKSVQEPILNKLLKKTKTNQVSINVELPIQSLKKEVKADEQGDKYGDEEMKALEGL